MTRQSMTFDEIVQGLREGMTVQRVFGDPIERDGVTIVPVAKVSGLGGGGGGGNETDGGSGGGFALHAKPVGAYEIRNGAVTWRPALDLNRVVAMGQLGGLVLLLTLRTFVKRRAKKR